MRKEVHSNSRREKESKAIKILQKASEQASGKNKARCVYLRADTWNNTTVIGKYSVQCTEVSDCRCWRADPASKRNEADRTIATA